MHSDADTTHTDTANSDREVVEVFDAATIYAAYNPFRYEVEYFDFEDETVRGHRFTDLGEAKKFAVRNA